MPRLKQPASLKKMSMDVLVGYFVKFFRMCTYKRSSDEFREGVAFIKEEIRPCLLGTLAVELYNKVLQEFVNPTCDDTFPYRSYVRIASELLFDEKITGVKCLSVIIFSLEQEDLIRIRGITELEFSRKIPHSLEMLHLKDLTVFKYVEHCSDSDLATLSKQCEKLEHVDVSRSDGVTEVGLRALAPCHNLRHLSVSLCPNVSLRGLMHFISVNKTIRELYAWTDRWGGLKPGFDYRQISNWDLDPTVYSSIESFSIDDDSSDQHLRSIVAKFPNLRSIRIHKSGTGNLSYLKSLSKLSNIDFYSQPISGWTEFEVFLESFGPQIHHLVLHHRQINDMQRSLNSMFRLCENLESLRVRCLHNSDRGKLVVPPFEKLQYLECAFYNRRHNPIPYNDLPRLELGQMSMLESFRVNGLVVGVIGIKSMILDHTNFPNLKVMELTEFCYDNTEYKCSAQIVKNNNLDLQLTRIKCRGLQ